MAKVPLSERGNYIEVAPSRWYRHHREGCWFACDTPEFYDDSSMPFSVVTLSDFCGISMDFDKVLGMTGTKEDLEQICDWLNEWWEDTREEITHAPTL